MPLSHSFLLALEEGLLSPLRQFLLTDRTLSPEIRGDTLTVYYRGKRLLKLTETPAGYDAVFDDSYILPKQEPWQIKFGNKLKELPTSITSSDDVSKWLEIIPFIKAIMDRWLSKYGGLEREAQQLIVQENNQDGKYARATDYYFCDMERVEGDVIVDEKRRGLRFDLVGVHWPSTSKERKQNKGRKLVIGEVKFGDGAHAKEAGLVEHFIGLKAFVDEPDRVEKLKQKMAIAFNQKHQLGFIQCQRPLETVRGFAGESAPIEWLLILGNHDPEKIVLKSELRQLQDYQNSTPTPKIQIRVATSSFVGYGLWNEGIVDLNSFLNRPEFSDQGDE